MKLTSIGLIARGLIVVATSVMAANTLQQVQAALAGLFFDRRACRSETPEQSTGLVPGTLRPETPVVPNTSSLPENSVLSPNSTGGTTAAKTGG